MTDQHAEYVAPFHPRRPVRFFAFRIKEQGQIWLEGTDEIVGVERDGDEWVILVKEEGPIQKPLQTTRIDGDADA